MKKDKSCEVKPMSGVIISLLGSQFIIKEFFPIEFGSYSHLIMARVYTIFSFFVLHLIIRKRKLKYK